MGKSAPLPDPSWAESGAHCVACGYALEGLANAPACPECGTGLVGQRMVLAGVVRSRSGNAWWRSVLWALIAIGMYVVSVLWPLALRFDGGIVYVGVLVVGLVGATLAMALTRRRQRSGPEKFVVVSTGMARVPLKFDASAGKLDSLHVAWDGANAATIKRVGPYWKQLRIGVHDGRVMRRVVFDAGIRCPDEVSERVRETVQACLDAARGSGVAKTPEPQRASSDAEASPEEAEPSKHGPNRA